MSLWADFLTNDQRIINKWKHYFPIYERHFSPFINKSVVMIEIGVGRGGSLQMWKRYLGPHSRIIGIDIDKTCKACEEDQVYVRIGDQSDPIFLKSVLDEFGAPDIVLDDGSHVPAHQISSFNFLYPCITKNGVYMVEDLHTAHWQTSPGGLRRCQGFIELCKQLIDELNADHSCSSVPPTSFTHSTLSMHFYDSVAVFERGYHTAKTGLAIGNPSL
jgi:hypothetical protein